MLQNDRALVIDIDHCKETALHWAAKRNNPKLVLDLLRGGAQINSLDVLHRTPLFHACKENALHSVHELLKQGADAELRDIHGFKPIDVCIDQKIINLLKKFENN